MSKQIPISVYYALAFAKLYSGSIVVVTENVNGEDVFITAYAKLCGKFYINDCSGYTVTAVPLKKNQHVRTFADVARAKHYLQQLHVVYTDTESKRKVCDFLHNYVLCVTFKDIVQNKAYCVCLQKVDMQQKYLSYRGYDGITNKVDKRVTLMSLDYLRNNVVILFTYFVACPNWQRYRNKIGE